MSENGEIYTTAKDFTLPPALTAWTNSTSELGKPKDNKTKKVFLLQSGMLHKTVIGSDFDQETVKKVADLHLLHD